MPYIKPKPREKYDPIVEGILLKLTMGLDLKHETILVIETLKQVAQDEQDGDFNYFVTKLFKRAGWHKKYKGYFDTYKSDEGEAIKAMLIEVFAKVYEPMKYCNINRQTGTIVNIADEFTRRYGKDADCIVLLLNDVKKYFDEKKGKYEDKKREENGDVTE